MPGRLILGRLGIGAVDFSALGQGVNWRNPPSPRKRTRNTGRARRRKRSSSHGGACYGGCAAADYVDVGEDLEYIKSGKYVEIWGWSVVFVFLATGRNAVAYRKGEEE